MWMPAKAAQVVFKDRALSFKIYMGEELSQPTKHAIKIIISIFWLWRLQSLTHMVADPELLEEQKVE